MIKRLILAAALLVPIAHQASANPDTILILADDLGINDARNAHAPMPNLQRLADRGVRFTSAYSEAECAPTRSSLLASRLGTQPRQNAGPHPAYGWGVSADVTDFPVYLQQAGIETWHFGKWHAGSLPYQQPSARGWDHSVAYGAKSLTSHYDQTLDRDGTTVKLPGYLADRLTDEALDALHRPGTQFVYLALDIPHFPMEPAPGDTCSDRTCSLRSMIKYVDKVIGRVIDSAPDGTVIIFAGDNGPDTSKSGGSAAPLRGHKHLPWDGGNRVPLVIAGPGFPAGTVYQPMVSLADIGATVLAQAGLPIPASMDGVDLSPLPFVAHHCLAWGPKATDSIRCGYWSLVRGSLFNLRADPGQRRNLNLPYLEAGLRAASAQITKSW